MGKASKKNPSTSSDTQGKDTVDVDINEQLDRAHAAVVRNQEAVSRLHSQWKVHLLRLSYLIIIVTFHQAQVPMTECIKEIKE